AEADRRDFARGAARRLLRARASQGRARTGGGVRICRRRARLCRWRRNRHGQRGARPDRPPVPRRRVFPCLSVILRSRALARRLEGWPRAPSELAADPSRLAAKGGEHLRMTEESGAGASREIVMVSGEDSLIARYFKPLATDPGAFDLTDDAAILESSGDDLVVTTDAIVEGVHFLPDDPPDSIARKALRVNLSDLAAKGATPTGFVLTLALREADEAWLTPFARGLGKDATQ